MISINPETKTERENYKLLIGSIIPRPIAFITSLSKTNTINGAPFSYFNVVTADPPLISVSIQRKNNKQKDTAHNILKNKEFVVHIVDKGNVKQINETAAQLPPHQSEIDLACLTLVGSNKVTTPGIKEAKIRYECVLEHHIELGGREDSPSTDLFVGKIVQYHIDESVYEDGKINTNELGAISRLAGYTYAEIGNTFDIERPK